MKQLGLVFLGTICLGITPCNSQTYQEEICDFANRNDDTLSIPSGTFSISTQYSNSGSNWEIDWDESVVFHSLLEYTDNSQSAQSYQLRIGKGGQIYSFKNDHIPEALPPQWRPSYDSTGTNAVDPGKSDPIKSHHGNWAPWNDEVWQFVGSDQRDLNNNIVKTRNIHQGGSYMNNFAHRPSDLTLQPFSSPMVQSSVNSSDESVTTISWGQSENPAYVYDPFADCTTCFSTPFKALVLYFQRIKNIGNGAIQVDFQIYNFNHDRGIDYWNVPFVGIRNSSLPYAFISDSKTDNSSYNILNSKAGHPVPGDENSYLPEFKAGAIVKTSGNSSTSSGWFGASNTTNGNGPCLGFVTSKQTSNPNNGYGDIRYGTAMSNATRDVTIFTRRANGGAADPISGLKPWGILGGESIKGRYFIVADKNIDSLVNQITSRKLDEHAYIEIETISEETSNNIYYQFTLSNNTIVPIKTSPGNESIILNSKAFTGSHPVFMISTSTETVLTSDPYLFSNKPYDGTVESIELLGFQGSFLNQTSITPIVTSTSEIEINNSIYPNPTRSIISFSKGLKTITNLEGKILFINKEQASSLNLSSWPSGVYFAKFSNGKTEKIVKR